MEKNWRKLRKWRKNWRKKGKLEKIEKKFKEN